MCACVCDREDVWARAHLCVHMRGPCICVKYIVVVIPKFWPATLPTEH